MKTNLDKLFKVDDKAVETGVWFDLTDTAGFLVRPLRESNPNFKAAMAKYYKPYAKQIQLGSFDDTVKGKELQVKLFVEACLLDWRGIEIDGVDTKYSPDIAIKFLMALPDLFQTLWNHCQDFKNYQQDVGNSSSSGSNGNTAGEKN